MNKVIEYVIRAKDATRSAISSALGNVKGLAAKIGSNLQNIRAGFAMLGTAAQTAMNLMQKAFAFEKMTVQFKTLIGSMDEARDHMKMLQELGDTPPFSLEEFASASRTLMVMTEGALGFKSSLELIGDAAAATGQSIDSLAHHVGLAYSCIRDGQPIQRATFSLRSMGVITPQVAAQLEEMQKAGASTTEMWGFLEDALSRYKGAMEETEKTGDGLMGAISAQWDDAVRSFGGALLETSKGGMQSLLDRMKDLNEGGYVEEWAEKTVEAFNRVADGAKAVLGPVFSLLGGIWKTIKGLYESEAQAVGNFVGTLSGGGSLGDAFKGAWAGAKSGWNDVWDTDGAQAEHDRQRREDRAAEKRAKREADAQKKEAEAARIRQSLEEGQRKIDEKNAQAEAEAYAKAYEEWQKKAVEQEERERIEMERKIAQKRQRLWQQEVKQKQADLSAAQQNESDAQAWLSAAQQRSAQAWGWYRDKDSLKAQLEEEKANAEAEKQFEKDFERLKHRGINWRTADNLSLEDEAVRRVGLAREEEKAAQQYAQETAEATREAADALEAIQSVLEEGGEE